MHMWLFVDIVRKVNIADINNFEYICARKFDLKIPFICSIGLINH